MPKLAFTSSSAKADQLLSLWVQAVADHLNLWKNHNSDAFANGAPTAPIREIPLKPLTSALSLGADPNLSLGTASLLGYVACAHQWDAALVLIDAGAHFSTLGDRLPNVLTSAVNANDEAALSWLLARGADSRVLDAQGHSLLHIAARRGSTRCFSTLANAGLCINALDPRGRSPLALAFESSEEFAVRQLIAAGADGSGVGPEAQRSFWWRHLKDQIPGQHSRELAVAESAALAVVATNRSPRAPGKAL